MCPDCWAVSGLGLAFGDTQAEGCLRAYRAAPELHSLEVCLRSTVRARHEVFAVWTLPLWSSIQ